MAWGNMQQRCHNPNFSLFRRYGGRGIYVDPLWRGRGGFDRFLAHVGPRPSSKHTLDRINNDGHYAPGNVRWATSVEQNNNTSKNVLLTYRGVTQSMSAWARQLGMVVSTLRDRKEAGWSDERALATPVRPKRPAGSTPAISTARSA